MRTELVEDALKSAYSLRSGLAGAVFHSGHGTQHTATDSVESCRDLGATQSMGGAGSSADNALAESFNASLKREVLQDHSNWVDAATCRRDVFRWLLRHNLTRQHSRRAYSSPAAYKNNHTTATPSKAAIPCPHPGIKAQGTVLLRCVHESMLQKMTDPEPLAVIALQVAACCCRGADRSAPTSFTVAGNTLVQHVEFASAKAFLVTAEPHYTWGIISEI